jgi:hypothetical protein
MTTTKYFDSAIDLATGIIAQVFVGILWTLLDTICYLAKLLWVYKTPVALTVAAVGFIAFCMAYPLFIVGLVIVAAYAYVTYPKGAK